MSRVMRFFCWLMALAVLLSGMCFEKIKADSILRCPEFSAAREVLEYTTESELAASAEMEFLPQVTCNTHSDGNVQEEAPAPQQSPARCGNIHPAMLLHTARWFGPTLKNRYEEILRGVCWSFIVSYIQCQGGTMPDSIDI